MSLDEPCGKNSPHYQRNMSRCCFFLHLLSISLLQTLGSPRGAKYITLVNRSPFCPLKRERERDKFPPNTCSLRSLLRYIILIHGVGKKSSKFPKKCNPWTPFRLPDSSPSHCRSTTMDLWKCLWNRYILPNHCFYITEIKENKQFILNLPRQKLRSGMRLYKDLSFGWGFGLSVVQLLEKKISFQISVGEAQLPWDCLRSPVCPTSKNWVPRSPMSTKCFPTKKNIQPTWKKTTPQD